MEGGEVRAKAGVGVTLAKQGVAKQGVAKQGVAKDGVAKDGVAEDGVEDRLAKHVARQTPKQLPSPRAAHARARKNIRSRCMMRTW